MTIDQQHILKDRIRELIGEKKVIAGLFYSFEFNPGFFENYVLPLLVPGEQFINNAVTNHILWRRLYKDNKVPPVTVYFDQDAKDIDSGPWLNYELVAVNMPMVGRNKGNFHPKHSFVLLENVDRSQELLVITGSNNITQSGWCDNMECVSEQVLINDREFPYQFRKDIKEFINYNSDYFNKGNFTKSESLIDSFLNRTGYTRERDYVFYHSYKSSFIDFLNENILEDASIRQVEIISPFFKSTPELIQQIIERKIKVKIQAPFRDNYCLLDETIYNDYRKAGVIWYYPGKDRNYHSKVYRFYGDEKTYTIVGSVNLTDPAWSGFSERPKNIYNIESAVLYIENSEKQTYFLKKEIKNEKIDFLPFNQGKENSFERFEIPAIIFTINWNTKTLEWKSACRNECSLHLSSSLIVPIVGNGSLDIGSLKNGYAILESIARKPVLKLVENVNGIQRIHFYYINQLGFESRPLEFRLSAADIVDVWEQLGDENEKLKEWLINRLEDQIDLLQDESGLLLDERTRNRSLLNEIARQFYGLVKLQEYLLDEDIYRKNAKLQAGHLSNIRYYLVCDNVDTLVSYLDNMEKSHGKGELLSAFYWLILNIILNDFYESDQITRLIKYLKNDEVDKKELRQLIESKSSDIQTRLKALEANLDVNRKKLKWILATLKNEHAVS